MPSYSSKGIDISNDKNYINDRIYPKDSSLFYSGILDMPDKLVSSVNSYDIVLDNIDSDLMINNDTDIKITNLGGADKSSLFEKVLTESTDYPNKFKLTLKILTSDLTDTEIQAITNNIYYININAKVDLSKSIDQFDDSTGIKKYNYISYSQINDSKDTSNETISSTISLPSVNLTIHPIESITKELIGDSYTITKFLYKPYEVVPKEISGFDYINSDVPLTGNSSNLIVNLSYKDIESPIGSGKLTTVDLNDSAKLLAADDYSVFLTDWSDNFTPKDKIKITLTPNQNIEGIVSKVGKNSFTITLEDEAGNTSIVTVPIVVVDPTGGNITVHYKDTENNYIAPDATISGQIGDPYLTEQLSVDGYTFKEVQGNIAGVLTAEPQTVTYIYTKNPVIGTDVTIQYHDTEGNTIAPDIVKSGNIGDSYISEQLTIDGYTFKEIIGNPTGSFTDTAQTVTYIYTKNSVAGSDITIHYQDSDGNTIAPDVVKSGNIGDSYSSELLTIDGYTFKEVTGNPNGIFTDSAQTVTYVYTKNKTTLSTESSESDPISEGKITLPNSGSTTNGLPKTGEANSSILTIFGTMMLLTTGGYILNLTRKKRN